MSEEFCSRCGSRQAVQRIVNDRFKAADPSGRVFEVTLQKPVWTCPTCRMSWEGKETLIAKERAYQAALSVRGRNA